MISNFWNFISWEPNIFGSLNLVCGVFLAFSISRNFCVRKFRLSEYFPYPCHMFSSPPNSKINTASWQWRSIWVSLLSVYSAHRDLRAIRHIWINPIDWIVIQRWIWSWINFDVQIRDKIFYSQCFHYQNSKYYSILLTPIFPRWVSDFAENANSSIHSSVQAREKLPYCIKLKEFLISKTFIVVPGNRQIQPVQLTGATTIGFM